MWHFSSVRRRIHSSSLISSENPLRIASVAGHSDFVKEILRLNPEFAKEIKQDVFSPMQPAAAIGHKEIVRELMIVDSRLYLIEGKEKKAPLHCATIKGRDEVISVMLLCCLDCNKDIYNCSRRDCIALGY